MSDARWAMEFDTKEELQDYLKNLKYGPRVRHTVKPPKSNKTPAAGPAIGDKINITPHEQLGIRELHLTVRNIRDDAVLLGEGEYGGNWVPKASLKQFVDDLQGKIDLPPSQNPLINKVLDGKAKFLGKGDDGLVFQVGDQVVKASTVVPYQPTNPGVRTPEQASEMLRKQVELGNKLIDAGVPGIQKSTFVQHGDKGFQIKDWVEIPEKFTRVQLDQVQDTLIAMHQAGYALNDEVQPGLDKEGNPVMFDIGKAAKIRPKQGPWSDDEDDMDHLRRLYQKHGHEFVRRDKSEGQRKLEKFQELYDRPKPPVRLLKMVLEQAEKELRHDAEILAGDDKNKLKKLLAQAEDDLEGPKQLLEWAQEEEGKSEKKTGSLRTAVIKLAQQQPDLRRFLIPLLRETTPK